MVNETLWGETQMKMRIGLGLGAVAVACLYVAPEAFAAGEATPFPGNALTYSAQTVAASATNQVTLPPGVIVYRFSGGAAVGDTIAFQPPAGASFIPPVPAAFVNPASGACAVNAGAIAAGVLTYTVTAACPATFGTFELTVGQAVITGLSALATPGNAALATITAQGTFAAAANGSDTSPVPVLALRSENTFDFTDTPLSPALTINLAGAGGSTPGTQFDNGSGGVSPAGFLGTFRVRARPDLNAATGQPLVAATAPTGTVSTTISGNFFSITSAYLTVNPASPQASCVSPAPAGSGPGVINTTNTSITFNPPLPAVTPPASTTWAVCIISGATVGGAPVQIPLTPVTLSASIVSAPSTFVVADNAEFGRIAANGSATYFQNVFGAANLYPTFFRIANPTSVSSPVFAILTRDGIAGQFFGPLVTVPGNNATFQSADMVAAAVGTSLVAGSQHATVRLLSPTASVLFSAVSQNATTLDISALP
jgi:hypothetical protein